MWPEGWLRRCPRVTGGVYVYTFFPYPIPDRRRPQQPTDYRAVPVGLPLGAAAVWREEHTPSPWMGRESGYPQLSTVASASLPPGRRQGVFDSEPYALYRIFDAR